jgi:hypothetical protein
MCSTIILLYYLSLFVDRSVYSFQVLDRAVHFPIKAPSTCCRLQQETKATRNPTIPLLSNRVGHSSLCLTTMDTSIDDDDDDDDDDTNLDTFQKCLQTMPLSLKKQTEIYDKVHEMGFESTSELFLLSKDFRDRPEALGALLRSDFGLDAIKSNMIRGSLMALVEFMEQKGGQRDKAVESTIADHVNGDSESLHDDLGLSPPTAAAATAAAAMNAVDDDDHHSKTSNNAKDGTPSRKRPLFKAVVVNQKAKQRHSSGTDQHNYGLPNNYKILYPNLANELDDFFHYMTTPSASLQESPIRKATASVYMRHAKLFLGWYTRDYYTTETKQGDDSLTINLVFPNKDAVSAQPIIDFILWLRRTRLISDSYEANMLRGLTKLVKYRFRNESMADPSYGEKSYSDLPIVRELRKLHRDANRRQVLSPRSSEEDRKWLEWKDYLQVVRLLKEDVEEEIKAYNHKSQENDNKKRNINSKSNIAAQRRIAIKFQSYLVLSFFSCVPDRQRTFRELEIDKSFIRDAKTNCWTIKHGPDDYKTGKTYGDRPPLVLTQDLTGAIDDFLQRWRPCLKPTGQHFFVQPRTGNSFTQDTLYSIVARSCFKHTGKKTNPHLLRDMIVTHVRDSNASEKELEALALYMGHSISMQRNSYDRRTVEQKVAPAVQLLRNVNRVSET